MAVRKKAKKKKTAKKRASKKKVKTADIPEAEKCVLGLRTLHEYQGALLRKLDAVLAVRNLGGGIG